MAVPAVFDLLEQNLSTLLDAGVDGDTAVALYDALLTYTVGFAAWQLPRAAGRGERAYRRDQVHTVLTTALVDRDELDPQMASIVAWRAIGDQQRAVAETVADLKALIDSLA